VALTVLREGSEVVLFLYGITVSEGAGGFTTLTGGLIGLALGALTSIFVYKGLLRIPLRYFFSTVSVLVTLLAAGLAAQAVKWLEQADLIQKWTQPLWDTSSFVSDQDWLGRILHALIGYTDRPNGAQLLAYFGTLTVLLVLMNRGAGKPFLRQADAK
jgi:high-affinity iron transporter